MCMDYLNEWVRLETAKKIFPREYGLGREVVYDFSFVKKYMVDKYMSVFSLWQRRMNYYDVIFIDVDGDNGESYWKFREVKSRLEDYGVDLSVIYFSGRGFHIYLWFDGFVFNDYGRTVRKFVDMVDISDLVDMHVIGDVSRMARMPHTYNMKSGLWVMKINPDWVWVEIKGKSKMHEEYDVKWKKNNKLGKFLRELDEKNVNSVRSNFEWNFEGVENNLSIVDEYFSNGGEFPECIKSWMKELVETGELDHVQRYNMALFLLHVWGYDKTLEFFRKYAADFKERYTKYQLEYMIKRKLKMYKCERLKKNGLCPIKKGVCPFYPTLNAWVRWK